MTKLMVAVVLVSAASLYNPHRVLLYVGPEARQLGWKLNHAVDTVRYLQWWPARRS